MFIRFNVYNIEKTTQIYEFSREINPWNLIPVGLLRNDRVKTTDRLSLMGVDTRIYERGILIALELIDHIVHQLPVEHP